MLQLFDPGVKLRQPCNTGQLLLLFADFRGGVAKMDLLWWDTFTHPTLGGDDGLVPDLDVTDDPDLPGQSHVVPQLGAARDAGLRNEDTMLPNHHVVSDLHQIVDLGAFLDPRAAKARSVDGGSGRVIM